MSPIIRWTPFLEPFEDMDKFFQDLAPATRATAGFMPAVDVYQDKDNVIVEAQLAGIDPEKVDISIENDVLVVKGESEKKSEVEDKNYYRKEVRMGSFFRQIALPSTVNEEKVSADFTGGVLKITCPKTDGKKVKKIDIKINN